MTMAAMATISPSTATRVQVPVEAAAVSAVLRDIDAGTAWVARSCGFAGATPVTTVLRPVATPIARTIKAVKVTIAWGDAILSSSR